jgi:hypothetical protein
MGARGQSNGGVEKVSAHIYFGDYAVPFPYSETIFELRTTILLRRQKHLAPYQRDSTSSTFRARGRCPLIPEFQCSSANRADPTEKAFALFAKIKGRTETALLALPSTSSYAALRVFNVRPAYVDPPNPRHTDFKYTVIRTVIAPVLRTFASEARVSPVDVLAKALVNLATGNGEPLPVGNGVETDGRTVRSIGVRRLGES